VSDSPAGSWPMVIDAPSSCGQWALAEDGLQCTSLTVELSSTVLLIVVEVVGHWPPLVTTTVHGAFLPGTMVSVGAVTVTDRSVGPEVGGGGGGVGVEPPPHAA